MFFGLCKRQHQNMLLTYSSSTSQLFYKKLWIHHKHCPIVEDYQIWFRATSFETRLPVGNHIVYTIQNLSLVWPTCIILYRFLFIYVLGKPSFVCGQPISLNDCSLGNQSSTFLSDPGSCSSQKLFLACVLKANGCNIT